MIGTRQQLSKIHIDGISVGNLHISSSTEVNNLGTWFDKDLSMSTYVTKVASSRYYSLYNIRHIRKYLSRKVCETLVNAFITSRLDYCNILLYGHPSRLLTRLQRVQNSAARIIHLSPRFSPSLPLHGKPINWTMPKKFEDFMYYIYVLSNRILLRVGCILIFIVNSEMKYYIQYFPDSIGHSLKHTLKQR